MKAKILLNSLEKVGVIIIYQTEKYLIIKTKNSFLSCGAMVVSACKKNRWGFTPLEFINTITLTWLG